MDKIEWPSQRVAHGGIFHQRNVNYSKETHNMIKSKVNSPFRFVVFSFPWPFPLPSSALMNEASLTMLQRNKINYFLRQGSALPQPEMPTRRLPSEEYEMRRAQEIMNRSRVVRKRSMDTIQKSGVFEIERWALMNCFSLLTKVEGSVLCRK